MTAQEIFDKMYLHVVRQGRPSIDSSGKCRYRGPDGLMCAAGILLTDKQATQREGTTWGSSGYGPWPHIEHVLLIALLQRAHDDAAYHFMYDDTTFLDGFKGRAAVVAEQHDLTVPEIT